MDHFLIIVRPVPAFLTLRSNSFSIIKRSCLKVSAPETSSKAIIKKIQAPARARVKARLVLKYIVCDTWIYLVVYPYFGS